MIVPVEELKKEVQTDIEDGKLLARLEAIEQMVRSATHNNFQNRAFRSKADCLQSKLYCNTSMFCKGDTIEISSSSYNAGIYEVEEVEAEYLTVNHQLHVEYGVLITKVDYPADVKMGAINIIKWQLKNEAANSGDKGQKDIQSESISRHSVTYATDSTEMDLDPNFGVPKKYTAFLKHYKKARF